MRFLIILLLALNCTVQSYAGKKIRVLFLGNSYTYVNDVPQLTANIAAGLGDTLVFDTYAPGGYTLHRHSTDATSLNKIKGKWDYLVLQEQSQLPALEVYQNSTLYTLCSLFRSHNPCSRIMLYMTWGRKNGDTGNCAAWPPVCTYWGMDSLLRLRYIQMAVNNHGELSPVGAAWRYTRLNYPGINLYDPDESHPSAAGSYLAACCFYTALFGKNPLAINYNFSLATGDANMLKQAAKIVVFDSLSYWNYTPKAPIADFSYSIGNGNNQVNCTNKSSLADSYLWDFGDGATSTLEHPVHNYINNGTYTITLTTYNCDFDTTYKTTYQKTASFCAFTPTITPQKLTICPGTVDTLQTQLYDSYQWYDENDSPVTNATNQYLACSVDHRYYVKATLNNCWELSQTAQVLTAGNFSTWFILPDGKLIGQDSACTGDSITLSVLFNKPPVADDSLIDWKFNGQPVTGYHNDTIIITQTGIYEATVRHTFCPSFDRTQLLGFTFIDCGASGINSAEETSVTIAPNPVWDMFTITSSAFLRGSYYISLINELGQTVYRQQTSLAARQDISLSDLSSGLYFIFITQGGNIVHRGKIIKQ